MPMMSTKILSAEKMTMPLPLDEDVHRAVRLLKILILILTRPEAQQLTKTDLAAQCRCSAKTIQRDIRLLTAEWGIYFDTSLRAFMLPEGAIAIADLRLSNADVLAFGLTEGFMRNSGFPQQKEILNAISKVTASLSPRMKRVLELTSAAVSPALLPLDYGDAPVMALLSAVRSRRTVEIDYDSANSSSRGWRKVDPYSLEPREGVYWELQGWCHNNRGFRTFALDRIYDITLMQGMFEIRSAEWEAFRSQNTIGGLRGSGAPVPVEVTFDPKVARYALRRRWTEPLQIVQQPDGSAILSGTIPGGVALDAMIAELLRWRRYAIVSGGPELLASMRAEVAAVSALYAKT